MALAKEEGSMIDIREYSGPIVVDGDTYEPRIPCSMFPCTGWCYAVVKGKPSVLVFVDAPEGWRFDPIVWRKIDGGWVAALFNEPVITTPDGTPLGIISEESSSTPASGASQDVPASE